MYSLPEGQKYNQLQPPPKQELSWFNHNNLRLKESQKLVESLMNTFKYPFYQIQAIFIIKNYPTYLSSCQPER